VTPSIG